MNKDYILGELPDFSNSKHIDLTDFVGSYKDGSLLASCFTNSFGDKIVYYRKYVTRYSEGVSLSGFEILDVILYHEGSHPTKKEMLEAAVSLSNKETKQ